MSEKRFVKYVNDTVKDTKTNKMYPYMGNIVNLLNELVEENEKLKEAKYEYKQNWKQASANCDLYKQEINFLKDEIKGFEEENEKLKCINKQLEERLENSGIGIALKMDCDMNEL